MFTRFRILVSLCTIMLGLGLAKSPATLQVDKSRAVDKEWVQSKIDPAIYQAFADRTAEKDESAVRVIVHLYNENNISFETNRSANNREILSQEVERVQNQFMESLRTGGRESYSQSLTVVLLLQYQYALAGTVPSEEMLEKLAAMDHVRMVELDKLNRLYTVEGRSLVGSDTVASSGFGGNGVGVAIIDSNFDLLHPELGGSTNLPNGVVYDGSNYSDPGTPIHSQNFNDCYHGTGTASIVHRYAPDASLYALTVFPNAYDSVIADAMNWCITNKNGSNGGAPIRVISMSLGGGRYYNTCNSGLMHTAAGDALSNGILVFAASGNDGYTDSMGSPACSSNVISVGSVWDENGAGYSPFPPAYCSDSNRLVNERTCYSDTASFLDIYAPSEEVMCAQCGGGTFALGGTSSACPAAAGMTAQMLHADSSYIGQKTSLLNRYQSTGVSVIGDTGKYRIDLAAAVGQQVDPPPTATFSASPTSITSGGSSTLSWSTTYANSVSISGVGAVSPVASGSVVVSPTSTTTYTLTATGDGGSVSKDVTVTVTTGGGGGNELSNGVTENISVATGDTVSYTVNLPTGATNFTVTMTGSGDMDLYVKNSPINWPSDQGSHDTDTFKAPYKYGSAESVTFASPTSGTWYVLVHGYSAGSGTLTATWDEDSGGGGGDPQWYYETYNEETPHNYSNRRTYTETFEHPGAQNVALHFDRLDTETNYDFVYIYDENNTQVYKVSGNLINGGTGSAFGRTDGWVIVTGSKITVKLVTDYSVTDWGFKIDNAAYYQ